MGSHFRIQFCSLEGIWGYFYTILNKGSANLLPLLKVKPLVLEVIFVVWIFSWVHVLSPPHFFLLYFSLFVQSFVENMLFCINVFSIRWSVNCLCWIQACHVQWCLLAIQCFKGYQFPQSISNIRHIVGPSIWFTVAAVHTSWVWVGPMGTEAHILTVLVLIYTLLTKLHRKWNP